MIKAKETSYAGRVYRSRTEARWAVFFDAIGIRFQYEAEGFDIRSGAYLPDFWLSEMRLFFEVKGDEPTEVERRKCAELATAAECNMLLAVGGPEPAYQLLWFDRDGEHEDRFVLARDRLVDFGFWLVREGGEGIRIGPDRRVDGRPKGPMFSGALDEAYAAAANARFERGAGKTRQPLIAELDPDRLGETAANGRRPDSDEAAA